MRIKIPDLQPGTKYFVELRGNGTGGKQSAWSRKFEVITDNYATLPQTPTAPTLVSKGSSFSANWAPVTTNVDGYTVPIVRYEIEWSNPANTLIRYSAVVPKTISGQQIQYDFSFEENSALFGSPQPTLRIRVRAVDNLENKSQWSTQVSATNPLPNPPNSFTATAGTGTIDLSWTKPNGATDDDIAYYNVYLGGFVIWSGNATRFTFQTATYSAQTFTVKSVDIFSQESTVGPTATATAKSPFTVDITPPNQPTFNSISIINNNTGIGSVATASWTLSPIPSDLDGYQVRYRKNGTSDAWIQSTYSPDTTTATIALPAAYTSYLFQIRAYDNSGNSSAWGSDYTVSGPANTTPTLPTGLVSTSTTNAITYSWTAISDADLANYELTISTSSTFASNNKVYLTGTATSVSAVGLSPNTTYYARLRSIDNGALASAYTATNTTITKTYQSVLTDGVAPPSSPAAIATDSLGYISVSWSPIANNDLVTYEVHMSSTDGFTPSTSTKLGEVTGTSYLTRTDPTGAVLVYQARWYFRIIAKDADGPAAAGTQGSAKLKQITAVDSSLTATDVGATTTSDVNSLINTQYTNVVTPALNGKNKVTHSTSTPGTTANNSGDTWFTYNGSNQLISQWRGVGGTSWIQETIENALIATLDASKINTGYLDVANRINTYSINATKMAIGDLTNYAGDGGFLYNNSWSYDANSVWVSSTVDKNYVELNKSSTGNRDFYGLNYFEVVPGESYYASGEVYRPSTNPSTANAAVETPRIGINGKKADGTDAGWNGIAVPSTSVDAVATDTWYAFNGTFTIPAGSVRGRAWVSVSGSTTSNNKYRFRNVIIRKRFGGELVVDGSITANKVGAGTFTGGQFIVGSGGEIRSNLYQTSAGAQGFRLTDTALEIKSGTVNANTLVSGTGIVNNLIVNTGGAMQSSDYAGGSTGWYLGNNTLTIRNGTINIATLASGSLNGEISVGGGGLVLNGGVVRSNTYGSSTYNAAATAGFFLSNGNLHIPAGNISANAFSAGTFNAGVIKVDSSGAIQSVNYSPGVSGWYIGNGTFEVNKGTISAAALNITVGGSNLALDSSFEGDYGGWGGYGAAVTTVDTTVAHTGNKSIKVNYTANASSTPNGFIFYAVDTVSPAIVANTNVVSSAWIRGAAGLIVNVAGRPVNADGSYYSEGQGSKSFTLTGDWQRVYTSAWTMPLAFRPQMQITISNYSANFTFWVDDVQIEIGDLPTSYGGSSTYINGNSITTGTIRSTSTTTIGPNTQQPLWVIPLNGNATFQGMTVRGVSVVGANGDGNASLLQSYIYSPGTAGWAIKADGTAELNNLSARGTVQSTTFASGSAGWQINANGNAEFNAITARGTVQSSSYVAGVSGWQINANGNVDITSGTIKAQALAVQYGKNLLQPQHADWEWYDSYYSGDYATNCFHGTGGGGINGNSHGYQFWGQAGAANITTEIWYGKSTSDYNVKVDPGTTYIVSGYYKNNGSTAIQNFQWKFRDNLGTLYDVFPTNVTLTTQNTAPISLAASMSSYSRFYGTFTTNGANTVASGILMQSFSQSAGNGDVYFDCLQMEKKNGNINLPSEWSMPGSTYIAGESIKTGAIYSTNYVAGSQGWKIDTAGNAEFNTATIVGPLKTNTSGSRTEIVTTTQTDPWNGTYTSGVINMYPLTPGYSNSPFSVTTSAQSYNGVIYTQTVIKSPGVNGQGQPTITMASQPSNGTTAAGNTVQIYGPGSVNLESSGAFVRVAPTQVNFSHTTWYGGYSAYFDGGGISGVGNIGAVSIGTSGDVSFGRNVTLNSNGAGGVFANLSSTSAAANMYISSGNQIVRASSSIRYKDNIQPIQNMKEKYLALEPKTFWPKDKEQAESLGNYKQNTGFIAEEAEALGLNDWVEYNSEGQVEGFGYGNWTAALQYIVREQQKEINELRGMVKEIASRMPPFEVDLTDL